MKIDNAYVVKPANGGVGLYVQIRGTREQVMGAVGVAVAKTIAQTFGWDPDGRGDAAGIPTVYGVDTYTRSFRFDHCLCHGKYGCKAVTGKVEYGGHFSGSESVAQQAENLRIANEAVAALL